VYLYLVLNVLMVTWVPASVYRLRVFVIQAL
jgi:hypothetical protein